MLFDFEGSARDFQKGEKTAAGTAKATQTIASKARSVASAVIGKSKGILGIVAAAGLFFVMIASLLASCGASIQGGAASTIASTTYAAQVPTAFMEKQLFNFAKNFFKHC